jgi:hypothetical protein
MTIQRNVRLLFGAACATLAFAAFGTPSRAEAGITVTNCPNVNVQLCEEIETCVGPSAAQLCTTRYYYEKPGYGGSGFEAN